MTNYEYRRLYGRQKLKKPFMSFVTIDTDTKLEFGQYISAVEFSISDYRVRFDRWKSKNNMTAPPIDKTFTSGYLVIGKPGASNQFECWMSTRDFAQLYTKVKPEYAAYFIF